MSDDESRSKPNRLGNCEVCAVVAAKYCCPRCEVKTCGLACLNIHKKELECSGIRNRVEFKVLQKFSNLDLSSDYKMLEEISRAVEKYSKTSAFQRNDLPQHLICLRAAATRRNVQLHFLPRNFLRRQSNTTFLNFESQELFWKIDWIFPQSECLKFTDDRILDSTRLSNAVDHLLDPLKTDDKRLEYYQAAGHSNIVLLMKADRVLGDRYYLLDPSLSLRDNFSGKIIVENPVILILHKDHKQAYDILSSEEESEVNEQIQQDTLNRKMQGNRRIHPVHQKNRFHNRNKHRNSGGNFLFSSEQR